MVPGGGGAQLTLLDLLLLVGLGDVAAQDVGDGIAVLIRAQEDVDLVPLPAALRLGGVLQIADVARLALSRTQRAQAGEAVEGV